MWDLLFDKGILTVSTVLTIMGVTLKHRTGTDNELIAVVLTIASIVIWSVVGAVDAWGKSFLYVFSRYGILRGVLSAGVSIWAWDLVHGTCTHCRKKEKEEENEEDIP